MHLKALTIKGFKSFAEPVTLRFEPGVTVVVGPNGSGKSNVVDAVAWVLGAQGPRTFRSQRMEDVIFAGSASRPPLGRAEVTLTIDNADGKVPGGLAEITIQRTLFRSGESEYALNGRPCRLLDIQELLSDAGVGRQQHVIVSQGQLDQVLQARPEERRAILEEAAGVLKHRRRRERAERRLAATQENLDRLADLTREVKRQLRPLERQASAARRHASLSRERTVLARFLRGQELRALEERRGQLAAEQRRLAAEELDLRDELARAEQEAGAATAEVAGAEVEELVAQVGRIRALLDRALSATRRLEERRQRLTEVLADRADQTSLDELVAELDRAQGELAGLAEELARAEAALAEARAAEETSSGQAPAEAAEAELTGLRETQVRHAEAQAALGHRRRALERERGALAGAEEQAARAASRLAALDQERGQLLEERAAIAAGLVEAQERAQQAAQAAQEARAALEVAEAAARAAERGWHRSEARAEALRKAAAQARGAAGLHAVQDLPGVLGLLGDLVEVAPQWRPAFEAAAGATVAAIVVEEPGHARAVLRRLAERDQPGTVLALGQPASPAAPPGGAGGAPSSGSAGLPAGATPLRALVQAQLPGLAALLDDLLNGVWAVPGDWTVAVDLALAHPELLVVSQDGARAGRRGWRVGGPAIVTGLAADEAQREASAARAAAEEAGRRLEEARGQAGDAQGAAQRAAEELRRLEQRQADRQAALDRVERHRAEAQVEQARAHQALEEARSRLAAEQAALAELEAVVPDLAEQAAAAALALARAEELRRAAEERWRRAAEERRRREVEVAELRERHRATLQRVSLLSEQRDRRAAEAQASSARRTQAAAELRVLARLAERLDPVCAQLRAVLARAEGARDARLAEQRLLAARLEELQQRRSELGRRLEATRERLQRIEVELAELGVRREQLLMDLAAFGAPRGSGGQEASGDPGGEEASGGARTAEPGSAQPGSAEEVSAALGLPPGTDLVARLAEVEQALERLGPVNPLALEELAALEERAAELDSQMADIQAARRDLQVVIRQVDDEVARLFAETFEDVDRHFQELVALLFPGGSGRLVLTDPADPLQTGVDVEARPAGKQVKRLSLLSGGERSLVALAFLFAVARSRPSPFYLMDEVEAALDDVNLHRFLGLVQQFRQEAQLIIVSHQKRTMEMADALYGVTMQTGGSSKVVSQRIRGALPRGASPVVGGDDEPDASRVSVGS